MRAKRRTQIQIRIRLHQFGLFPAHIERVIRLKDVDALLETMNGALHFTISCLRADAALIQGHSRRRKQSRRQNCRRATPTVHH